MAKELKNKPYIPHICKRISREFPAGWLDQR
jgi:hypothetical protein